MLTSKSTVFPLEKRKKRERKKKKKKKRGGGGGGGETPPWSGIESETLAQVFLSKFPKKKKINKKLIFRLQENKFTGKNNNSW